MFKIMKTAAVCAAVVLTVAACGSSDSKPTPVTVVQESPGHSLMNLALPLVQQQLIGQTLTEVCTLNATNPATVNSTLLAELNGNPDLAKLNVTLTGDDVQYLMGKLCNTAA